MAEDFVQILSQHARELIHERERNRRTVAYNDREPFNRGLDQGYTDSLKRLTSKFPYLAHVLEEEKVGL